MHAMNMSSRLIIARIKSASSICLLVIALYGLAGLLVAPSSNAQLIGDDLMLNGGFEQDQNGAVTPWRPKGGLWTNPEITWSTEGARSGNYGITIETQQLTNPWVSQSVPIESGSTYQFSTWVKALEVQSSVGIKFEFYDRIPAKTEGHLNYDQSVHVRPKDLTGDWQEINVEIIAPPEAVVVVVYLRLYGEGKVYYDDASFVLLHKPLIEMTTDEIFYYADVTEGWVDVDFFPPDNQWNDNKAEIRIFHEQTHALLIADSMSNIEPSWHLSFDPSQMVKEEPYRVQVKLLDYDDIPLEIAETTIYRFDRPSMLQEDGTLIVDGEPFFPVAAYHVLLEDYPYAQQVGVNTVQGRVVNKVEQLQHVLDTAEQNGLKVLVPLYYDAKINLALIGRFVNEFKDHPAVLAWMIMDEPVYKGKTEEELTEAYRLIRTIDKVHPTYTVESTMAPYEITAKTTDIFATDPYPLPRRPISTVGEYARKAQQVVGDQQPFWIVLQAMYNPPNHPYLPTIVDVRNMAYQSLLSGAQGLAYYSFNENTFVLRDSVLWDGLKDFKEELNVFGELITNGIRLDDGHTDHIAWMLWQDEDDELYAAVVNTSQEDQQITIPLNITGYHVVLLFGDSRPSQSVQGNQLHVEMGAEQALLYHIVPLQTPPSANLLNNASFELANVDETAPEDWLLRQGSRHGYWVQDEVHDGAYAVSLFPDNGNIFNVINSNQLIPVSEGSQVVLRGWVKNASTTGDVLLGLRQVKENGTSTINYIYKTITPNSDWTYYELVVTPHLATKYVQVYLRMNTETNGAAWFDDLYVGEIPGS